MPTTARRRDEIEHRHVVDRDAAQRFLDRAMEHLELEVYDDARPIAYSRTTYLDSDDDDFLATCGSSLYRRARIREYAGAVTATDLPALSGVGYLEYKESSGKERVKVREGLPAEVLRRVIEGRAVPSSWQKKLDAKPVLADIARKLAAGQLRPRLTTWYRRLSLVGPEIRVTVDEAVAVCAPIEVGSPPLRNPQPGLVGYIPGRILEIKVRGETPAWLTHLADSLPAASNLSKFASGMHALRGRSTAFQRRETDPLAISPVAKRDAD